MDKFSQTQISNFATAGGLLAIVLSQVGVVFPAERITFILASLWSLGWTFYNFYQRYQKGDLNLSGIRK